MALTAIVVFVAFVVFVSGRDATRFLQQRHASDDFAGATQNESNVVHVHSVGKHMSRVFSLCPNPTCRNVASSRLLCVHFVFVRVFVSAELGCLDPDKDREPLAKACNNHMHNSTGCSLY